MDRRMDGWMNGCFNILQTDDLIYCINYIDYDYTQKVHKQWVDTQYTYIAHMYGKKDR